MTEPWGHYAASEEKEDKQLGSRQCGNSNLTIRRVTGAHSGETIHSSQNMSERLYSWRHLTGNKAGWHHFPPAAFSISTEPTAGSNTASLLLPYLHTPSSIPCDLVRVHFSVTLDSFPSWQTPHPEDRKTHPAYTMSLDQRVLQGLSSGGGDDRSPFTSRPEHT